DGSMRFFHDWKYDKDDDLYYSNSGYSKTPKKTYDYGSYSGTQSSNSVSTKSSGYSRPCSPCALPPKKEPSKAPEGMNPSHEDYWKYFDEDGRYSPVPEDVLQDMEGVIYPDDEEIEALQRELAEMQENS